MTFPDEPNILAARIAYDPVTGELTWKPLPETSASAEAWNRRLAGKPALNCLDATNGYLRGNFQHKKTYAHRVAFAIFHKRAPVGFIDHINGDRADNRIENLRECSKAENNRNTRSRSKTGFKGVNPCRDKWQAHIKVGGQKRHLGTFENIQDAAAAYDAAAEKHFGAFARTNAMMGGVA